ncbi:MAG TPA: TetR/AcrR family transcriptional regulator [Aeromicrobium sp.]|nr:TetR/AcrR family transcriptional regulator [Aeromicrobium sp.]
MSRAGAETRERVIQSAKERMRRHGVEATSMLDAIADAGASRGSLYHYFPGGKAQLIEEATAAACEEYSAAFSLMESLDAAEAIPAMLDYWRTQVEATDFSAGCPVAAAALSGGETEGARSKAGAGFTTWAASIEKMLLTSGVPAARATTLASLILSTIEGAVVVSLAQRSVEPMEQAAAELLRIVDAARG